MSKRQKKSIQCVRAIFAGGFGLKAQYLAPMIDLPTQLWAAEPEERHGQKVQVMIWLHPWGSVARELDWKACVASTIAHYRGVDKSTLAGMEEFDRLENAGAIECVEKHCALKLIWD